MAYWMRPPPFLITTQVSLKVLWPSPEVSTSTFAPGNFAYSPLTRAAVMTWSPVGRMIMTGFFEGRPTGPTGDQPMAVATRGEFSTPKAVAPPAEWPTAATRLDLAVSWSTEAGSADAFSTASSDDSMTERSTAAEGGVVTPMTWAARLCSK